MANQIQANVYQIDGNPQGRGLPNLNYETLSFPTSEFLMYEATLATQPSVQSAIQYYPSPNNRAQYTTFYASDALSDLTAAANVGGTTQIAANVYSIDLSPFRTPVPYTFPANRCSIWPVTDGGPYVYGFIEYNGKKYYTNQTEAQLVTEANSGDYKVYTALLSQSGTDAPVATVLQNTLGGEVVWSYNDPGSYTGTLAGAFPVDKTVVLSGYNLSPLNTGWAYYRQNSDSITLLSYDEGTQSDGSLNPGSIEIRVYS